MRAIYNKSSLLVARINNGEMCGTPPVLCNGYYFAEGVE